MARTTDTLGTDELVLEVASQRAPSVATLRAPRAKSHEATPRKAVEERWCSTLAPRDLRCLMSVIEQQLMPQMLRAYSPARCLHDKLSDPMS